jgi:hypothetical protein
LTEEKRNKKEEEEEGRRREGCIQYPFVFGSPFEWILAV